MAILPFLLNVEHLPSGFTRLTYDAGPDKRISIVTPTISLGDYYDNFDPLRVAATITGQGPTHRRPGVKG